MEADGNAVVVAQEAAAPMIFGNIVGLHEITVRTIAAATAKRGGVPPLDIMFVIDITGSMSWNCTASVPGISHPDKLDCAKLGMRTLLEELWPCSPSEGTCTASSDPVDMVGLMVFPGTRTAQRALRHLDCSNNLSCNSIGSCDYAKFNANPHYEVVPLSNDFKLSADGPLNGGGSDLVRAIDWAHGASCGSGHYGLECVVGGGAPRICTYFADVIEEAQVVLETTGRPDIQDVIIFLSDGDSNSCSGMGANQCSRAINEAQDAAAAGTWVYSIAYEASSSSWYSCNTDYSLSGLETMEAIASDPSKFFNQPHGGDLTEIFRHIADDLSNARLIPPDLP